MEAPAGRDVPKGTDLNKYLANTKDIGITYGLEDEGAEPNQLYLFVDADWGNEKWTSDNVGRRSQCRRVHSRRN